jgi:choline monooxygenase
MRLRDFVTESDITALYEPTARAIGLPGDVYADEFFCLEQRHLFPRTWCAIAVGPQVPNPGDAIPVDLAGWPLLVVRNRQGEVGVFHNVCRHRGMRVVTEQRTGLKAIACPWHSWTYDLDGHLVGTPEFGGERVRTAEGLDHATLGLKRVRSARWMDLVFVNIDEKAPELDAHLKPLKDLLDGRDLGSLRYGGVTWGGVFDVNWKLLVEGGIEDYHLPWVHPEMMRGVLARNTRTAVADGVFAAISMEREYGATDREEYIVRQRTMPKMNCAPGVDPNRSYFMNVFPTGGMGVNAHSVHLFTTLPDGPYRTRLTAFTYFVGDGATAPQFAESRQFVEDRMTYVFGQDIAIWRQVQANAQRCDVGGIRTRFSPNWEGAVHHFQKMVVETIRASEMREKVG